MTKSRFEQPAQKSKSILFRSALLAWTGVISGLGLFIVLVIPIQKDMLQERLESTAQVVATSIEGITVSSIVVEDYSPVIEHCHKVVVERPAVLYIVIVRKDGFSLVHRASGWSLESLKGSWQAGKDPVGNFDHNELTEGEVYHYAYPLDYSGIKWGWIHIGLSLDQYRADVRALYLQLALLGFVCIALASVVSLFFARRLSRPIQHLDDVTRKVAAGDLDTRAHIATGDEVESLADSFNQMTEALKVAQEDLERRVEGRTAELSTANLNLQETIGIRRVVQEQLEEAQSRLRHLLISSPTVIYSCETSDQFATTFISENVVNLLGFEASVFLEDGTFWMRQVHMEDLPRVMGEAPTLFDKGHTTIEYRLQAADGRYRWIHDEMRLMRDNEGEPVEIVGSLIDITERRSAQDARNRAEAELEEQRALSMRSDRLRSLGEMAAGIAHELNQPLVGVRGLAEHILIGMERGWKLDQKTLQDRVTRIVEQADRMVHIIEHVRLFAREAGKPEPSSVCANDVVESAVDMVSTQLRSRGLSLSCELRQDLPRVFVNPFSLEEVLLNVLNNARDALEAGGGEGGRIVVRTDFRKTDDRVEIQVEDSGVGIPEEIVAKVFDPFFTTKDPDKGTGLGLAISKSIVEEFGGTLSIQSTAGLGTIASILLPAEPGQRAPR